MGADCLQLNMLQNKKDEYNYQLRNLKRGNGGVVK